MAPQLPADVNSLLAQCPQCLPLLRLTAVVLYPTTTPPVREMPAPPQAAKSLPFLAAKSIPLQVAPASLLLRAAPAVGAAPLFLAACLRPTWAATASASVLRATPRSAPAAWSAPTRACSTTTAASARLSAARTRSTSSAGASASARRASGSAGTASASAARAGTSSTTDIAFPAPTARSTVHRRNAAYVPRAPL
jgi:hypothetical protein